MPEYLAPGVFVEETSFRSKSIEGVSTSTTAFIGLARRGPAAAEEAPELLTSFSDFERVYGGLGRLRAHAGATPTDNYLAHAVWAYFNEGGARLFFARVLADDATAAASDNLAGPSAASADIVAGKRSRFVARVKGPRGDGKVLLRPQAAAVTLAAALNLPVGTLLTHTAGGATTVLLRKAPGWRKADDSAFDLPGTPGTLQELTLDLTLVDANRDAVTISALGYDAAHPRALAAVLSQDAANAGDLLLYWEALPTVTAFEIQTAVAGIVPDPALGSRVVTLAGGANAARVSRFEARFKGSGGNGTLLFTETATPTPNDTLARLPAGTIVRNTAEAAGVVATTYYLRGAVGWLDRTGNPTDAPAGGESEILSINLTAYDADDLGMNYENLALGKDHPRFIGKVLPSAPASRNDQLTQLFAFTAAADVTAFDLRDGIQALALDPATKARRLRLSGGFDGTSVEKNWQKPFDQILAIDDVSIIAAPGHTELGNPLGVAIQKRLVGQAETRRSYRIAVLDVPKSEETPTQAAKYKAAIDSKYAALYYPWVVIPNPDFNPNQPDGVSELVMPPSGFVCGIYARSDIERGVWKAPANEVVRGALRFRRLIATGEQELLNPLGVNCLRYFAGRGYRVWGARTVSSDPEWKYVNVRRYFNYLERSIDRGTQWAVFEPNGPRLWANIRETVSSFLYNEWVNGALLGDQPEQAYFVRCDRSTMTQNNLDNGQLICLIGVAVLKPAEFVIFRIGQKTADARS